MPTGDFEKINAEKQRQQREITNQGNPPVKPWWSISTAGGVEPVAVQLARLHSIVEVGCSARLKWRDNQSMAGDFDQLIHDIDFGTTDQRAAAASALGELSDRRAIEPLLELLKDPYSIVRCAAIYSLGKLRDWQAVEPLLNNLAHPDEHTQTAVVKALGQLGDPRAIPPLQRLLQQTSQLNPLSADIAHSLAQLGASTREVSSTPTQEKKRSAAGSLFYLVITIMVILLVGMIVLIVMFR